MHGVLQKQLRENGINANSIKITYLEDQGRIQLTAKRPNVVYLHQALCNLLGIPYINT
jgi:hypothetical protein